MVIETRTVTVQTADGDMVTEIFVPSGNTATAGIIVYMDARGVRDELREMCARLASPGYAVFLPDLFHRMGRQIGFPSETSTGTPEEIENIIRHIRSTTNEGAMIDTAALLDWVEVDEQLEIASYGTVGYCMGGPFAFASAGRFPDKIAAAASFYGVGLMTDKADSPHLKVASIQARLYFGYAERDHLAPVSEIPALKSCLEAHGVVHEIEIYHGVDHGFAFPRRAAYDADASERHWQALFRLFQTALD